MSPPGCKAVQWAHSPPPAPLGAYTDGDKLKWLSETVLVNPQIVEKSGKTDVLEEGCLSFPGMAGDVSAHTRAPHHRWMVV